MISFTAGIFPLVSRHDFRLVPAAMTLWLGSLLGLFFGWQWSLFGGLTTCLIAAVVLWRKRVVVDSRKRILPAVLALLCAGVVLAIPSTVRLFTFSHDPLHEHVLRGEDIVFRATVSQRPKPIASAGYANQQSGTRSVVLLAKLEKTKVLGEARDSSGQVAVIAEFVSWSALVPGQEFTARGKLAPPKGNSDLSVAAIFVRGPPSQVSTAPWWQSVAGALRADLRKTSSVLPEDSAGLFPGLVVGDTDGLSPTLKQEFTDAGLSHLVAVSGSNIAILCGAVLLLLRACRVGPKASAFSAGLVLLGFVLLVGPDPSVLRAGVMAAVGLFALLVGRRSSAVPALALAVGVLVALDPAISASLGFALSVFATAALVLLAPAWSHFLVGRGFPVGIADLLAVSLAAFLVTTPIIVGMSGRLSLISVIANIVAVPFAAPITVLGILATLCAPWWAGAAKLFSYLAEPELSWLVFVARRAANFPGAVMAWPVGLGGALLATAAVVSLIFALRLRFFRVLLAISLVGLLVIFVPIRVIVPSWPPPGWVAVACDVGQGDALVLATAEPGRAVVVDVGPDPGLIDRCLTQLGIDRIPLLVISHLHADHIGGLSSVFDGRSVGAIALGAGRAPTWGWKQVTELARRHQVPVLELDIDQRLEWPGLSLDVLGPRYVPPNLEESSDRDGTEINNSSVVLRAETRAGRILMTGDVELAAQADLLSSSVDLKAEVLKVPHHGSRYSLPQFINAVAPRVALISVGKGNSYGHPNRTTIENLVAVGALVARTDNDGDSAILADPSGPSLIRRGQARSPP